MKTTCAWLLTWVALALLTAAGGRELGPQWWCNQGASSSSESDSKGEGDSDGACTCAELDAAAAAAAPWARRMDCSRRGFNALDRDLHLPRRVTSLDLSGNPIPYLENPYFQQSQPLETLIMSGMGLVKVSDLTLAGLVKLKTLDLSRNRLENISENFLKDQVELKVLDLSSNFIKKLPSNVFQNVTKLDTLSLSDNADIGHNLNESLKPLKEVLKKGLRCLKISYVGLSHIPEDLFHDVYNLKELHIAFNFFKTFPPLYLGSLQVLNVSGTMLSVLQAGGLLSLPNLRHLYMDNMAQLETVDHGAFVGAKFLETLSLEKCHNLTTFNAMAFGSADTIMPSLRLLSLAHGGLRNLSSKLLPIFQNVTDLRLRGNPWICDCKLGWLKKLNISKENERHLRCFLPRSLQGRPWSSLEQSDFVCLDQKARLLYGFIVTLAVIFSFVLLVTLCVVVSTLRRKYRMLRRSQPMRYEPMMVQMHPHSRQAYWEETDSVDSLSSVSFIRESQRL